MPEHYAAGSRRKFDWIGGHLLAKQMPAPSVDLPETAVDLFRMPEKISMCGNCQYRSQILAEYPFEQSDRSLESILKGTAFRPVNTLQRSHAVVTIVLKGSGNRFVT